MTRFELNWQPTQNDKTFCHLKIFVGNTNVTEMVTNKNEEPQRFEDIAISVDDLGQWILGYYFELLNNKEPRNIRSSGGGWALPNLSIFALNERQVCFESIADADFSPFSKVKFLNSARVVLPYEEAKKVLSQFLDAFCERLEGEELVQEWNEIKQFSSLEELRMRVCGKLALEEVPRDVEQGKKHYLQSVLWSLKR